MSSPITAQTRTAEIARSKGATVYEYNNPAERVVGCAYRHFAERINAEGGLSELDGIIVINADNVLAPDYISRMNDAFVATGGEKVITSYRNSENFGRNYMTCLYGIFFIAACRYESRGRTVCNCSTRVSGTGFLFRADLIKEGWNYVSLTEDWEFSADRISRGMKVFYCDDAQLYDEQPKTIRLMLRQRLRWARGHTVVFFTRIKQLARSFFRPKKKGGPENKFSIFDISMSLMPLGVMGVVLGLAQAVCVAVAPLVGVSASFAWWLYGVWAGRHVRHILPADGHLRGAARHPRAQAHPQDPLRRHARRRAAVALLRRAQRRARRHLLLHQKIGMEAPSRTAKRPRQSLPKRQPRRLKRRRPRQTEPARRRRPPKRAGRSRRRTTPAPRASGLPRKKRNNEYGKYGKYGKYGGAPLCGAPLLYAARAAGGRAARADRAAGVPIGQGRQGGVFIRRSCRADENFLQAGARLGGRARFLFARARKIDKCARFPL